MKEKRRISGFTMAEMLIVVAIIAVLAGVGFVAVQNHQRNMAMLERDTIAKEIFVAAQNHLTLAESQGYLGANLDDKTKKTAILRDSEKDLGTTVGDEIAIYDAVYTGGTFTDALNIMLPFGAIDETVRAGGRYVIRYQAKPARVLDVFYWTKDGQFGGTATYDSTMLALGDSGKTDDRKRNSPVIGWFGGEAPVISGSYNIKAPSVRVVNEEKLYVVVKDYNTADSDGTMPDLKLIITGDKNKDTKVAFVLPTNGVNRHARVSERKNDEYIIILDDITQAEFHFADLNKILESTDTTASRTGLFDPGEDIVVQAVAFSNKKLSNIAYSNEVTTNSLFAELEDKETGSDDKNRSLFAPGTNPLAAPDGTIPETDDTTKTVTDDEDNKNEVTAYIANFRQLENLDKDISNVAFDEDNLDIKHAVQIEDMDWNDYKVGEIGEVDWANSTIVLADGSPVHSSTSGFYKPVNATYLLSYDGGKEVTVGEDTTIENHTVTGVKTNWSGDAGLFGKLTPRAGKTISISNLTLIDFDIQATGNVGALAGTLTNTTVSDVLAYHSSYYTTDLEGIIRDNTKIVKYRNVTSQGGNAGGLIGFMDGGTITQSAVSLYVNAEGGNAGGLIGAASGVTIASSYSGGHTEGGYYSKSKEPDAEGIGLVNVLGKQSAGGLIGDASGTTSVQYCYSTCSTCAKVSGGLIGSASDSVTVAECYAAGLVLATADEGAKRGTFLGDGTLTLGTIEDKEVVSNYYVSGINGTLESGTTESVAGVLEMSGVSADADAMPNDIKSLGGKPYSYLTVAKMAAATTVPDFLVKHYGDWQIPINLGTDLLLTNAEKLTAKVSFSFDETKFEEGQLLTMLIHGETSKQTMYLVFGLYEGAAKPLIRQGYVIGSEEGATKKDLKDLVPEWIKNSGANCSVTEDKKTMTLEVNFDDITTANAHFAELFPGFIPGENIIVSAEGNEVSFEEMKAVVEGDEEKWSEPIEDSDPEKKRILADRTNGLFASFNSEAKAVNIENFRHLENLDGNISALGNNSKTDKAVVIEQVTQTEDLDWDDFKGKVGGSATKKIHIVDMEGVSSKDDCYLPVNPSQYVLAGDSLSLKTTIVSYNGKSSTIPAGETEPVETTHKITGVKIDNAGNAGLFGSMITGSSISNLELIGFDITSTAGNAGTLAGALEAVTVSNIKVSDGNETNVTKVSGSNGNVGGLIGAMKGGSVTNAQVHGEKAVISTAEGHAGGLIGSAESATEVTNTLVYGAEAKVTATNGNAGGLIGNMNGGTVTKSAAAVIVSGRNAGGLIGSVSDSGTITACYAGGHTIDKIVKDEENKDKIVGIEYSNKEDEYNVTAKEGYAGGLIGNAGKARIDRSYSTCSAYGTTAGGFVGTMNGGSVTKCYSTGLVGGTTRGAFAGGFEDSRATDCLYYEIINGPFDDATYPYMTAIGNNHENSGIKPLDTMENYSSFVGVPDLDWKAAEPYNPTLTSFFGKVVEGKTVSRYSLKTVEQLGETVGSGDFVATHYGDWPAPEALVINTGSAD